MSIVWFTDPQRQAGFEKLLASGYTEAELRNTYTTQEGDVFSMRGAMCPRCARASSLKHRIPVSGYFVCPGCGVMYDEPNLDPDEYVTNIDELDE